MSPPARLVSYWRTPPWVPSPGLVAVAAGWWAVSVGLWEAAGGCWAVRDARRVLGGE